MAPQAQLFNLHLDLRRPPSSATRPPEAFGMARDEVKLLVLDKTTGRTTHTRFWDLPRFLQPGDVLVVNASATIPASLHARYASERLRLHLAARLSDTEFIVERRTHDGGPDQRPFPAGAVITIEDAGGRSLPAQATVVNQFHPVSRLWRVYATADLYALAMRHGQPIRYSYVDGEYGLETYQTVFARVPGSAEMPSAGRPFSHRVLRSLAKGGVRIHSIVLHTSVSSHEVETDLAHHPVLPEWYHVPETTAHAVNRAKHEGGRVIAVGTTVVRTLETVQKDGVVSAGSGWTTHLVTPASPPRIVHGLVTGMHETQTSHLALLYSFVHQEHVLAAYNEAVELGYLWHEFGDANLIL